MDENNCDLMSLYFQTKDLLERNHIINHLLLHMPEDGKDFFLKAFKRERYLDMRLSAVRGYAAYATEEEVNILMKKMLELLKRIPTHTPYAYSEYESMRSVFLMPYLLKHYHYECFRVFSAQLEEQYNALPDCLKDVFTLDENGCSYNVRDPKEVSDSWRKFYSEQSQQ